MTDSDLRYQSAPDRRALILARLRDVGFLSSADLARELGVSQMTVRRDLHLLATRGQVRTVHGGVSLVPPPAGPVSPADGDEGARRRIALCALTLLGDDDTIAVDAGPTARELAQILPRDFRGSVITHSMPVMQLLTQRPAAPRLVALGGELLPARQAFVGPATLEAIGQVRARTFFLAAAAVDPRGVYARSSAEAGVERRLMQIADRVVLLAPHGVFAESAPALVGPLSQLSAVVTDRPPPPVVASALTRAGTTIHVAAQHDDELLQ
jgi:DeoR/GlpR family transcriptional regulator of sugar metabolism